MCLIEQSRSDKKVCLLKAMELTQDNVDVYISLAECFFQQRKLKLALECYLKSIDINDECNYFRQIKVGFIYFFQGEEELCMQFLAYYFEKSEDI